MALMRLKSCYENCRTGLHEKIILGRSFARLSCSGDAFDRVGCFSSVYIYFFFDKEKEDQRRLRSKEIKLRADLSCHRFFRCFNDVVFLLNFEPRCQMNLVLNIE